MSGSAALEYGFPSTHSTNAASVAVYALFLLGSPTSTAHPKTTLLLEIGCYAYVLSILLGRLYCGMHGFMDVGIGSAIGALLSVLQCVYGEAFDEYLHSSSWVAPLTIAVIIITLIRIHPEPADDCPCFDDSVAFGGVVIGLEAGNWHYGNSGLAWNHPAPATVPFDLQQMGWFKAIARILVGVLIIFLWREVMKPLLLRGLPPLYRIFEKMGVSLPRKYFIKASQYKEVPAHLKVDNVFPSVSDLPSLLSSMRHPRKRAISVGPQSAADAYETLAYRETRRRESISAGRKRTKSHSHAHSHRRSESVPEDVNGDGSHGGGNYFPSLDSLEKNPPSVTTALSRPYESRDQINQHLHLHIPSTPHLPRVNSYERMMGSGSVIVTPASPSTPGSVTAGETFTIGSVPSSSSSSDGSESATQENEKETREMFSRLQKPRVRYDVEVVTKLIVYSGIAWLAVEGNPILFDLVGLGMGKQTR
ncbi:MAG: hypothetical protein M1819_001494 [Sarea resinae]|nr:MAG: hypothetical protein M1819_001494 [Sarea resinae]